jgi:NADH-quinone oxidoreductase subunit J
VALRNPVHCGLALLTLLLHVAGLFVLLNAEFLFAVQIIVYAGAILVLYLFVLMLLNLKTEERHLHQRYAITLVAGLGIFGELLLLVLRSPFSGTKGDAPAPEVLAVGGSQAVGLKMFSDYVLQFEIVGIFLLGAIIGAIVLAKTPTVSDERP